ncbi:MAG: hypothetical protein U9P14_12970 [Gemmatimonadota bacterium]|nr:hypothetical protein [Gemmatimonadota bacterium]
MRRVFYFAIVLSLAGSLVQAAELSPLVRRGVEAYNQGSKAYEAGRFAESVPLLLLADTLIGGNPRVDRHRLRYKIGLAYLKNDQPVEAYFLFRWIAEQDSTFPYIGRQLESCARRSYNQGRSAFLDGRYPESLPLLLHADSLIGIKGQIDRLALRFTIGRAYLKSAQPEKALGFFQCVAGQDSSYPYLTLQLATCAEQLGKTALALRHYRAALAGEKNLGAQRPLILVRVAKLLEQKNDLGPALEAYNEAIELASQPEDYYRRGVLLSRMAGPLDFADDQSLDLELSIRSGRLNEKNLLQANELRQRALDDFRQAAKAGSSLAEPSARMIERCEIIIRNNRATISEIHYQRNNK